MTEFKCVDQCYENKCLHIRGVSCEVFTEPEYFWQKGRCPALRNTYGQMKELRHAIREYEVRMRGRE